MDVDSPEIQALKAKVCAADEEFSFAQACHEAWKPAAYDPQLHQRLGYSYASNTFNWIRLVLRREMILALMRLWDKDKRNVDMRSIANTLSDQRIVNALATDYAAQWGTISPPEFRDAPEHLRAELAELVRNSEMEFGRRQSDGLRKQAEEAVSIVSKYREGGSGHSTLQKLTGLRNEHLAHRNIAPTSPTEVKPPTISDEEVEYFYQDSAKLIRLLLFVVHQTDYRPDDTATIHAKNAAYFWASVRGERTEGHPSHRPPRHLSQPSPDDGKVP